MEFNFSFRDIRYELTISESDIKIISESKQNEEIKVHICGEEFLLEKSVPKIIKYK